MCLYVKLQTHFSQYKKVLKFFISTQNKRRKWTLRAAFTFKGNLDILETCTITTTNMMARQIYSYMQQSVSLAKHKDTRHKNVSANISKR